MRNKTKYTPKYFKEDMPEWKRIKDPPTSRIFYRPISFYIASIATRMRISANTISYFSLIIAICSCICIGIPNNIINIIGAILVNVWLILDCVDGDIARTVKKQPYGKFADGISSYVLVSLLGIALGFAAYFNEGFLIEQGSIIIILLGTLASMGDTLMRLIYQKFKNTTYELIEEGIIKSNEKEKREKETQTNSLLVRIESDFGIGGIIPILVLISAIMHKFDLIVLYCFVYYFFSSIIMSIKYIVKAIRRTKELEK